jgi:hypothetical protein
LRGPPVGVPGGTITINVGPNDSSVHITDPTTQTTTSYKVEPGKDATITLPNAPGGTVLHIQVGTGINAQFFLIELIELGT